jgi:hypothetical protein
LLDNSTIEPKPINLHFDDIVTYLTGLHMAPVFAAASCPPNTSRRYGSESPLATVL